MAASNTGGRGRASGPPCFASGFARRNRATHATVCGSGEIAFAMRRLMSADLRNSKTFFQSWDLRSAR